MDMQTFWNEAYKEDPDQVEITDVILDEELQTRPAGTALDLGCGAGSNALNLAQKGWTVTGVDWAEHAIKLAKKAAHEKGLNATFYVDDITSWDPPTQFDLVISMYALPGGEDNKRVLQTAVKALAPGGTLIVAEWDKSMTEVWGFGEDELLSPAQITDLLPGLEIEKAEVRHLKNIFSDNDMQASAGNTANVAFVRARKR